MKVFSNANGMPGIGPKESKWTGRDCLKSDMNLRVPEKKYVMQRLIIGQRIHGEGIGVNEHESSQSMDRDLSENPLVPLLRRWIEVIHLQHGALRDRIH